MKLAAVLDMRRNEKRRANAFRVAASVIATIFALIMATPSAQAVGTYNRTFVSEEMGVCLAETGPSGRATTELCSNEPSTRWRLLVKSDSYMGSGHEVWQLESNRYRGYCLISAGVRNTPLELGSCQYSGSVHNKFEAFKVARHGENIVQLKDIEQWESGDRNDSCIGINGVGLPLMQACNQQWSSFWDPESF